LGKNATLTVSKSIIHTYKQTTGIVIDKVKHHCSTGANLKNIKRVQGSINNNNIALLSKTDFLATQTMEGEKPKDTES